MREIKQDDIVLEAKLLKILSLKKYYNQFIPYMDYKRLIPLTVTLLKDYAKWYEKYNTDIDFNTFYTEFSMNWHHKCTCGVLANEIHRNHCQLIDPELLLYYRETVFPLIQNSDIDDKVIITLLEREASEKIQQISDKGFNQEAINQVLVDLNKQKQTFGEKEDEEIFNISGVDVSILDRDNGLPWFLPSIQAGLGSHMPGQFVVISADSDTGKSAFCISQAVEIFKHLNAIGSKRPILYCTSEDTKEDLVCRFLSCLYCDEYYNGFEDIIERFPEVSKTYENEYDDTLFIGMSIRSPSDFYKIKHKIDKYNPALIIIDMLDKLSNSDNIQDLTQLYQNIRGLANDGYQIIGTSQSGNTSWQDKETGQYRHRKHLTDKDLANSKSGKQGAAYCMIMIGKDDDIPNIRYLDTTKKKRGKHCNATCEIIEKYSLYRELL